MVCIPLQLFVELKTIDGCSIALQNTNFSTNVGNLGSTTYNS